VTPATLAAVRRITGLTDPPTREQMDASEYRWAQQIVTAWVDGEIPGFPVETEFDAAGAWLLHVCHEQEAKLRREMFA
jgi:hypothetical protein